MNAKVMLKWVEKSSGIGAGIDSFFEYIFKSYILFGDDTYLGMWKDAYTAVMGYIRSPDGIFYSPVNMDTGTTVGTWIGLFIKSKMLLIACR